MSRKKTKILVIFIAVATLILTAFFGILNSLSPKIVEYSSAKVKTMSTMAVNNAVLKTLANISYSDIVIIQKDNNGAIVCFSANAMLINNLARVVVAAIESELNTVTAQGVDIPLGNLSNFTIFVGLGPNVRVVVNQYQAVTCEFLSEFESAGINQTRHKIILRVNTMLNIIVPTSNKILNTTTDIVVAEAVIVGGVPNTYLDFSGK